MDILDRARELGGAIAGSNEYQELLKNEKAYSSDEQAVDFLKQYEKEKTKIRDLQQAGISLPESAVGDLESLQDKIQSNASIQKLLNCQKVYEGLLKRINEEINKEIEKVSRNPI